MLSGGSAPGWRRQAVRQVCDRGRQRRNVARRRLRKTRARGRSACRRRAGGPAGGGTGPANSAGGRSSAPRSSCMCCAAGASPCPTRPSCESATPHAQRMSRRAGRVGRCDQTATPRPRKPGAPGEGLASAGSAPPPACDPAPSASLAATCRGDAAMRTRGACTRGLGAAKAVAAQRRAQNRLQAGWPQGWGVCGRVGGRQAGAK